MTQSEQLEKDIAYCIDECGLNDEQIGLFLRASEEIGVHCQSLALECVFESETMEVFERLHLNPDYLKINWRLDS